MKTHPMQAYGDRRKWRQRRIAEHFQLTYGRYRQLVNGHGGASLEAAQGWAGRSHGAFDAMEVLLWHQRWGKVG